jgi:hypothetical protein
VETTPTEQAQALRSPALPIDDQEASRCWPPASVEGDVSEALALEPVWAESVVDSVLGEVRVETAFGGVFYLINLGLFLDLYGDFTQPMRPGLSLPIWDFVALLGRELIGERLTRDPVWPLLARLAGRVADEPPGADFVPPDGWRIPPAWLDGLRPGGAWRWATAGARLQVWHPLGFAVLDVSGAPGASIAQARAETARYRRAVRFRLRQQGVAPRLVPATPRERWLAHLTAYVRVRLRLALGVRGRAVAAMLCAHRARVSVTATRLEVRLALADLPVAVRLAGLDRDPGWVPAAGRSIGFVFD